jgi:hypothetical protein
LLDWTWDKNSALLLFLLLSRTTGEKYTPDFFLNLFGAALVQTHRMYKNITFVTPPFPP